MLERLLNENVYNVMFQDGVPDDLSEIRLRLDKPPYYACKGRYFEARGYAVTRDDLDYTLGVASEHSVYAVNDSIVKGYITCGNGYRIGICGIGVLRNGILTTVKNITSLCIRIPHEVIGCCSKLMPVLEHFDNTLLISSPGLGKTTMLRECIRILSDKERNVLVLDERCEIAPVCNGHVCVDIGKCSDIASGIPKTEAYKNLVRSVRPDIVATDEVFGAEEVAAIEDIVRCGVKVIATIHANTLEQVFSHPVYRPLGQIMNYFVVLSDIGKIGAIYDKSEVGKK